MASNCPDIKSFEDILRIDDFKQAGALMKKWGVSMSGLKTLDDAKTRLMQFYQQEGQQRSSGGQGHGQGQSQAQAVHGLERAVTEHNRIRDKLLDKFRHVEKLHSKLSPKIQRSLESSFPNVLKNFKERKESLRTGECTILVAGEVGAGKSTLINLLLNVQLFPCDSLKCTNVICEIRNSDSGRKDAFVYFKTGESTLSESGERERKVAPRIINLGDLKGIQEFQQCVTESNEYDDNPYDRIEVFYPFKMLSKGVVIIDTPGIEGGANVDHNLQKYLSKAFGFIYVINTTAAGGVQQGRLGHLLNMVVNTTEDFSPDSSLFICNKWEFIPEEDKEDVKRDIFTKLGKVYPGIKPDMIHYMALKKAQEVSVKFNNRIEDHNVLLKKVEVLIPNSLRQGMTLHYWWLSSYLKRASYLLHVSTVQIAMSRGDLEKQCDGLRAQVDMLQKNTNENIKALRDKLEYELFRITKDIKTALESKKMMDNLCDWRDTNNCPKTSRKWKHTADEAAVKISERLSHLLDGWERENKVLKTIDTEIVEVFSKKLGLMEHHVKELEDSILRNRGGGYFCTTMKIVPIKAIFAKKHKKIERTYNTLGGAVSCVGMLNTDKKEVRNLFRDYGDRNKCQKMSEATILFLKTILNHNDLQVKLRKFFNRFFNDIDEAATRIPQFLMADQQLIETISQRIEDGQNESVILPQKAVKCQELLSSLDILFVNEINKFDYELSELDWDRTRPVLGVGRFADVYEAIIKRKNQHVALKVSRYVVKSDNITDILTEDRTMRDLKHPNIVKYYGSSYTRQPKGIKWIMIMEKCKCTLKKVYTDGEHKESNIPARYSVDSRDRKGVVRRWTDHCCQIWAGLQYVHEKGYTHRDMTLENILLSSDGTIKLTDVGVAKKTNDLLQTCNGSPAYIAPEVLLGTRTHSHKVDVYSTSFIIWEMWFGKDITNDMYTDILGMNFNGDAMTALKERQSKQDGGFRPSFRFTNKPPDNIRAMMERGWHYEPESRPEAKDFVGFFQDFKANN